MCTTLVCVPLVLRCNTNYRLPPLRLGLPEPV
jgi:hypothetical protein